ncbi:MAG: site-2 protease family protein [Candidatus Nanohaloarchaea archaeon]|nr:site-2 protease family protein [Candidatus Nanohaloarchaea archaeon]
MAVSLNLLSIVVFLGVLAYLVWRDRENIERYSIVLVRRTKRGIEFLDRAAGISPRMWRYWSTLGVGVGFIGMAAVFVLILRQTLRLFVVGGAAPPVGPVLPTVSTVTNPSEAGYLGLPFWHFLISLTVVMVVHELMHGVIARVEGFDLEYVGLLLIGVIPGAFVQPEGQRDFFEPEKEDDSGSPWGDGSPISRLRVLAAGPMANITLALILGILLYGAFTTAHGSPELRGFYEHSGMKILNVSGGSAADRYGLERGMVITSMGGHPVKDLAQFQSATRNLEINQTLTVQTRGNGSFQVTLGPPPRRGGYSYHPAPVDYLLPLLERNLPGTIDLYEEYNDFLVDDSATTRIARWKWWGKHYSFLENESRERVEALKKKIPGRDSGYMGVLVAPAVSVKDGLQPYFGPVFTFFQILFFIALLNFMIGAANLLPVKGLDGGWMLDTAMKKYLPGKRSAVVRSTTILTVGMIAVSFLFLISRHLL